MTSRKSYDVPINVDGEGLVSFTASIYGNIDLVGDRVVKGAFADTLQKWRKSGRWIPITYGHEWGDPFYVVGHVSPFALHESDTGLEVTDAQLDVKTNPVAAQVWRLASHPHTALEASFGYDVPNGGEHRAKDGANDLGRLDLLEICLCLKGANPMTAGRISTKSYNEFKALAAEFDRIKAAYEDQHRCQCGRWITAGFQVLAPGAAAALECTGPSGCGYMTVQIPEHAAVDYLTAERFAKSTVNTIIAHRREDREARKRKSEYLDRGARFVGVEPSHEQTLKGIMDSWRDVEGLQRAKQRRAIDEMERFLDDPHGSTVARLKQDARQFLQDAARVKSTYAWPSSEAPDRADHIPLDSPGQIRAAISLAQNDWTFRGNRMSPAPSGATAGRIRQRIRRAADAAGIETDLKSMKSAVAALDAFAARL